MITIRTSKQLQKKCDQIRIKGLKIGFVPTMGALHDGHLSLVRRSVRDNDFTVVSIFVNPKQFGPNEDFTKYPRTLSEDRELLKKEKVDCVFTPSEKELYGEGSSFGIVIDAKSGLTNVMCGSYRPGHFEGVATVVSKLWNIVGSHTSYFGSKDYQQGLVVQQLARDLKFPVRVKICPIVREPDGLAMSSRNRYLSAKDRERALHLYGELSSLKKNPPERWSVATLSKVRKKLSPHVKVQYLEARDAADLGPVTQKTREVVVAIACFVGKTRLIDNVTIPAFRARK